MQYADDTALIIHFQNLMIEIQWWDFINGDANASKNQSVHKIAIDSPSIIANDHTTERKNQQQILTNKVKMEQNNWKVKTFSS